jgi:hypothetical protein
MATQILNTPDPPPFIFLYLITKGFLWQNIASDNYSNKDKIKPINMFACCQSMKIHQSCFMTSVLESEVFTCSPENHTTWIFKKQVVTEKYV